MKEKEPVDFKGEVNKLLLNFNFINNTSKNALTHFKKVLTNKSKIFLTLLNLILEDETEIKELKDVPYICDSKN